MSDTHIPVCNICGLSIDTPSAHGLLKCHKRKSGGAAVEVKISKKTVDALFAMAGGFLYAVMQDSARSSVVHRTATATGAPICGAPETKLFATSVNADVRCPDCLALIEKHSLPG